MSILTPAAKCADREYDVAISFLVVDENIAASIKGGLSGLNVFFLPTHPSTHTPKGAYRSCRRSSLRSLAR